MAKNPTARHPWTRDATIVVLGLYCRIPFTKVNKNHPEIIRIAKLIGHSPSSVGMKIGNLGSCDEQLKAKGIKGLVNCSKLDKYTWDEFSDNWQKLAQEAHKIEKKLMLSAPPLLKSIPPVNIGKDIVRLTRRRVNQNFFRESVLSSYNETCCISKINEPKLLNASHIKPWAECNPQEKVSPHNGLCLNALHDRAFDRGLIAVDEKYRIRVSKALKDNPNSKVKAWIADFSGKKIIMPEKFLPSEKFLNWHMDNVFRR